METKSKIGDRVRVKRFIVPGFEQFEDKVGVIKRGPFGTEYAYAVYVDGMSSALVDGVWAEIEAAPRTASTIVKAPRFILQYNLDTDPFELFTTERELRHRIAELAARPDLKRDSIRVYDIKRVRTVSLGVKITLK
jgi:hypothetical protein